MTDAKKCRSARKGALTREYSNMELLIEEGSYDILLAEKEKMKELYLNFRTAHETYHDRLDQEDEISTSFRYLEEVQKTYTMKLKDLNTALKDVRAEQPQDVVQDQSVRTLAHMINLPPLKIETFTGTPEDYDSFVATFNEVVCRATNDPAAKLIRLKTHVSGIALDAIRSCRTLDGEDGYSRAMKILEQRFGSPHIVCNTLLSRLRNGADIRTPAELRSFADELSNAEATLKGNDMFSEMDTQNNIVCICRRLLPQLRFKWRDLVMKKKKTTSAYLRFSDFVYFVQEQADIVNDPIYGMDALIDRSSHTSRNKKYVSSLPVVTGDSYTPASTSSTYDRRRQHICYLCDCVHYY